MVVEEEIKDDTFPPGKYFIGDPYAVLGDFEGGEEGKICKVTVEEEEDEETPTKQITCLLLNTPVERSRGFPGSYNINFYTTSSTFGCIPWKELEGYKGLIVRKNNKGQEYVMYEHTSTDRNLGYLLTFDKPFRCEHDEDAETFEFGPFYINVQEEKFFCDDCGDQTDEPKDENDNLCETCQENHDRENEEDEEEEEEEEEESEEEDEE